MLDWGEREHEDVDSAALNHQPTIDALRACGLYKYWVIPGMRAHVPFLEWLVERMACPGSVLLHRRPSARD